MTANIEERLLESGGFKRRGFWRPFLPAISPGAPGCNFVQVSCQGCDAASATAGQLMKSPKMTDFLR
jgi:hypothetical protein